MTNLITRIFKRPKIEKAGETSLRTVNPPESLSEQDWKAQVRAGANYTPYSSFEDPSLVEDAGDFNSQHKIELIISLQRKCKINQQN